MVSKILEKTAKLLFTVEEIDNPILEKHRMDTCKTCTYYDAENDKCTVCGCFMSIKTRLLTNRNPKRVRIEHTHCPMGLWEDKELANYYRQQDGLELLT